MAIRKATFWLAGLLLTSAVRIALAQDADAPAADTKAPPAAKVSVTIHGDKPGAVINPDIYGQFAEHLGHGIYGGLWVGKDSKIPNTRGIRNDVVGALKELHIPVLRWPGGCFADEYHWRDGVGPAEKRAKITNTNWGGVSETNAFGTDEFMDLCEQLGTQAYVSVNVGGGTVREAAEWVEYMTGTADSPMTELRAQNGHPAPYKVVKYIGIGNEAWGCGGHMRPEYYSDLFRQYTTFIKNFGENRILHIASGANSDDTNWTDKVVGGAGSFMNGIGVHYYTIPTGEWKHKGAATGFSFEEWENTLRQANRMEGIINDHLAVMDKHDPRKHVGMVVDEWGIWTDVEPGTNPGFLYQQNSMRDAVIAGMTLNIFHHHSDRIIMANIAQMVNVLQAMVLTDDEKMVLTPTYYVFDMYKPFQGATNLSVDVDAPAYSDPKAKMESVSVSAAKSKDGVTHIAFVNLDAKAAATVITTLDGFTTNGATGTVLTSSAIDSHNTFDKPDAVKPTALDHIRIDDGKLMLTLPAKSVVVVDLK